MSAHEPKETTVELFTRLGLNELSLHDLGERIAEQEQKNEALVDRSRQLVKQIKQLKQKGRDKDPEEPQGCCPDCTYSRFISRSFLYVCLCYDYDPEVAICQPAEIDCGCPDFQPR